MLAQQPFCFSAKGILEHDSHNQCAKHCSHRLQPWICGPKLFSPASKRNTNKQHKQQNNDDNAGSAVAFTSFDFGPYLSKRTSSDIPDVSGRTLFVLCDGYGDSLGRSFHLWPCSREHGLLLCAVSNGTAI